MLQMILSFFLKKEYCIKKNPITVKNSPNEKIYILKSFNFKNHKLKKNVTNMLKFNIRCRYWFWKNVGA